MKERLVTDARSDQIGNCDAKAITEPLFQVIFNILGPFVEEIFVNSKVTIERKYPKQIIVTVVQTTYELGAHP